MAAAPYAALMNKFYHLASRVLLSYDAVIDKLIGDEVMALFIPGIAGADYRRKAAQAGYALLEALNDEAGTGRPWLEIGVAVHAGSAYVGNVGGQFVSDFTALGDTVNTAARLQSVALAGQLLLSDAVYPEVADNYPNAKARIVSLRGKEESIGIKVISVSTSTLSES
jgi:adenylate cyclase